MDARQTHACQPISGSGFLGAAVVFDGAWVVVVAVVWARTKICEVSDSNDVDDENVSIIIKKDKATKVAMKEEERRLIFIVFLRNFFFVVRKISTLKRNKITMIKANLSFRFFF